MSGNKAKRLRKLIYGDLSLRNKDSASIKRRKFYQKAKKKYKSKRWTNKRLRRRCVLCHERFKTYDKCQKFCSKCRRPSPANEEDIRTWTPFFERFFDKLLSHFV